MRRNLTLALAAAGIGIGAAAWALGGGAVLAAEPTGPPVVDTLPAPPFGSPPADVVAGSPLDDLVANGTITDAQANAIHDGLAGYMGEHWPPVTGWSNGTPPMLASDGPLATVLDGLVKDGTLTQAQATAVQDAMTQLVQSHSASGVGPFGGARGSAPFGGPPSWAPISSDTSSS